MQRFKLIKEYPDSPKLGTIINFEKDSFNMMVKKRPNDLKEYPEFWEEVKEKEYTILSFISNNGVIRRLTDDGKFTREDGQIHFSLESLIVSDNIHSIRRKSDNETFQLGDKVTDIGTDFEITNFEIGEYIIGGMYACGENVKVSINLIKHDKRRKPILITEDGKEMFEGDNYSLFSVCTKANWQQLRCSVKHATEFSSEWKHFHTKEAREEYIKWNKPMYSLNDVKNSCKKTIGFRDSAELIFDLEKLGRK